MPQAPPNQPPRSEQKAPASKPPSRMTLGGVSRGPVEQPQRVLIYGTEGIGKSTFAANAPAPIFLCSEDGTASLNVARFPEPRTWPEAFEAIRELGTTQHEYKTLAIDSVDWLEPLIWRYLLDRDYPGDDSATIEKYGYGKGYTAALDEWRKFLAALDRLRKAKGMWIVLVGHSHVKTWKNPAGQDFDRYQLKINDKAAGLLKEWSDAVLFAHYETFTTEDERTKRVRGVTGARVIETTRTAAWDAKNRDSLPEQLPLSWEDFAVALKAKRPADPAKIREEIAGICEAINTPEATAKIKAKVESLGNDAVALAIYKDLLAAKLAQKGSN